MNIKKALCAILSVMTLIICMIFPSLSAFADDELTYEIGKEVTAENNADTYFFDESFGSDVAVNAMKLVASVTVVDFNSSNGFAMKFIINNNTNSNDFYFLTMETNSWAYSGANNPIEAESKGTYTLEFDLSSLGQVFSIKGDLWQGTMILNGIQLVDDKNKEIVTYGNIIEPTVGYYKAGEGKVKNPTTAKPATTTQLNSETTTTASTTQPSRSVTFFTTALSNNGGQGFSFWWIAVAVLAVGVILIALAIILTKKMK